MESRLIVAQRVTDAPNDKEQRVPTVEAIVPVAGSVESVLGFRRFMLRGLEKAQREEKRQVERF